MSTIRGRCAGSALKLTSRPHRVLIGNAPISTHVGLKGNSIYGLYAPNYSSSGYISSRRHASSSSTSDKKKNLSASSSKSYINAKASLANTVNPPPSTLPAHLDLPPDNTSSSESVAQKARRYISIGRAYLGFYKTGLKNVYLNYKASLPIRRELGLSSYIPYSPPSSARDPSSGATSLKTALDTLKITRADYQLVRRAAYDIHRIIPFGLLLIICGEFTPLIVVAIGDAVTPYTCRVPKQLDKTRTKRLQLKQSAFAAVQGGLGSMKSIPTGSAEEMTWLAEQFGSREFASTASAEQVLRACAVFGLANSLDRGAIWVPLIYRPRLQRWTEYLALDDRLIVQGGGVSALSAMEVKLAVEERGGVGVGADSRSAEQMEKEEKQWLSEWLKRRKIS